MHAHAETKMGSRHLTPKSSKHTGRAYTDENSGAKQNRNDGSLAPLKFSGNHQMLQGKKRTTEAEDLVKYMSSLPCYLQHVQKEDTIQTKALNFGVLDWGHLERWKYKQKRATVGRTEVHSPSSSDSSLSSFSSFGSSTVSGRSDFDTCSLTQRKQFPSSNFQLNSSNEEGHSLVLDEKPSKQSVDFIDKRTAPTKDQRIGKDCSSLILKEEKGKVSEPKVRFHRTSKDPDLGTLYSNSAVAEKEKTEASDEHSPASNDDRLAGVHWTGFSEDFRFKFATSSSCVPHSCPLPCSSQSVEWSASESGSPVIAQGAEITSNIGRSVPSSRQKPTVNSKGKHSARHSASASFDIAQRDKGSVCARGKASPLRRILDPLFRHRVSNYLHFDRARESVPTSKPPSSEAHASTCGTHNSCKARPLKRNQDSLSWVSISKLVSFQDDKSPASSMHALLQIGRKNGLPLFTFTYNDTEILAATMRKVYIPGTDDFDCIYTFYSVHVVKKKSEGIKQGSNRETQGYHSNIIGRMKVTCCPVLTNGESKDHFIMREFVLTSAEQRLVEGEELVLPPNYELAAIVIKVPNEMVDSLNGSGQNDYDYGKSDVALNKGLPVEENSCYSAENLQFGSTVENQRLPSILAMLPNGVHGLPGADGIPSSLIDRWKSGGSCDCGGWDVGCTFTILANQDQPNKRLSSHQAHCTFNKTHQVDLFIQGGSHESNHVFSLVASKEGVYMVDFKANISLLQAFATCIAILHGGKPAKHSEVSNLVEDRLKTSTKAHGETPSSYVLDPPISPAGRI